MGSATAHALARRGIRVIGLDSHRPPHRFGSSHGGSRVIRMAYFEDPAYVPLLRRAYDLWAQLEATSGRSLLRRTGALMIGPEDSEVVAGSSRAAREHALDHEILDAEQIRRRFPVFAPESEEIALFESIGGALKPELAVETVLQLAAQEGAELRFQQPVHRLEIESGVVTLHTAEESIRARRVVLCAGAGVGPLLPASEPNLQRALTVSRKVVAWLDPQESSQDALAHWQPDRLPVWVWAPRDAEIIYGTPAQRPTLPGLAADTPAAAKVGIHSGRDETTWDQVDRQVSERDLQALQRAMGRRLPALVEAPVVASEVCLYTHTPDDHFLLGPHPEHAEVLLGAGFSGHGFKFAPVIGEILCQWTLDDATQHPVDLFRSRRLVS